MAFWDKDKDKEKEQGAKVASSPAPAAPTSKPAIVKPGQMKANPEIVKPGQVKRSNAQTDNQHIQTVAAVKRAHAQKAAYVPQSAADKAFQSKRDNARTTTMTHTVLDENVEQWQRDLAQQLAIDDPTLGKNPRTKQILVDMDSVKNEEQAMYFSLELANDGSRERFLRDYAKHAGIDAEVFIESAEDALGEKLFKSPVSEGGKRKAAIKDAMTGLAGYGLIDVNGRDINIQSADFNTAIQGIRNIADKDDRNAAFKQLETLTKTKGSRFYGYSMDGVDTSYRDSALLPLAEYTEYTDSLSAIFDPSESGWEKSLRGYQTERDAILERYANNPVAQRQYLRALDKAFASQMGVKAPNAEELSKAIAQQDEEDAAKAAQKEAENEDGSFVDWVAGKLAGLGDTWGAAANQAMLGGTSQIAGYGGTDVKPREDKPAEEKGALQRFWDGLTGKTAREWKEAKDAKEAPREGAEDAQEQPSIVSSTGAMVASTGGMAGVKPLHAEDALGYAPQTAAEASQVINAKSEFEVMAAYNAGNIGLIPKDNKYLQQFEYKMKNSPGFRSVMTGGGTGIPQEDEFSLGTTTAFTNPDKVALVEANLERAESVVSFNRLGWGDTANELYSKFTSGYYPEEIGEEGILALANAAAAAEALEREGKLGESGTPALERLLKLQGDPNMLPPEIRAAMDPVYMAVARGDNAIEQKAKELAESQAQTEAAIEAAKAAKLINATSEEQDELLAKYVATDEKLSNWVASNTNTASGYVADYFFESGGTSGFKQSELYIGEQNKGVIDDPTYKRLMKGMMAQVIAEDATVAELYGGADMMEWWDELDSDDMNRYAFAAHARLVSQGKLLTDEDEEIIASLAAGTGEDREGVGMATASGHAVRRGIESIEEGTMHGAYVAATILNEYRAENQVRLRYSDYAYGVYGADFYKRDLQALIDSGTMPEGMAAALQTELDTAENVFDIGVDPTRFSFTLNHYAEARDEIRLLDEYAAENFSTGEMTVYNTLSTVTEDTGRAGISLAVGSVFGPMAGLVVAYGFTALGEEHEKAIEEGYGWDTAKVMACAKAAVITAANYLPFDTLSQNVKGLGALLKFGANKAIAANPVGVVKATAASWLKAFGQSALAYAKAGVKQGVSELGDTAAELVGAELVDTTLAPPLKAADEGQPMTVAEYMDNLVSYAKDYDYKGVFNEFVDAAPGTFLMTMIMPTTALGSFGAAAKKYSSVRYADGILSGRNTIKEIGFTDAEIEADEETKTDAKAEEAVQGAPAQQMNRVDSKAQRIEMLAEDKAAGKVGTDEGNVSPSGTERQVEEQINETAEQIDAGTESEAVLPDEAAPADEAAPVDEVAPAEQAVDGGAVGKAKDAAKMVKGLFDQFVEAFAEDLKDPEFRQMLNAAAAEALNSQTMAMELIYNGNADGSRTKLRETDEQVKSHETRLGAAQTALDAALTTVDEVQTKINNGQATQADLDVFDANVEAATKQRNNVEEITRERDQKKAEAKDIARKSIETARTNSQARIAAEDEARFQRAAQRAQEAQAAAEQEAAAKEDQRQRGNVTAMDAEAFIEENYPNAPEAEKQKIREAYMALAADEALKPKTEAEVIQNYKGALEIAGRLAQKFGARFQFVDTLPGGAQGAYTRMGDTIFIRKDATQSDALKGVIVHELTHRAETTGHYRALAESLLKWKYGDLKTDAYKADIRSTMNRYKASYERAGRTDKFTAQDAQKEIIADICAEMIAGNNELINSLVYEKPSVARRVLNTIKDILKKLTGVKDTEIDQLRRVEQIFEDALSQAKEVHRSTELKALAVSPDNGEELVGSIDEDTVAQYSLRTWTDDERSTVRQSLLDRGFAERDVDRWIDDVDSVARVIAADRDRLDFTPAENQVMLKPNQEYVKTLDASTLCAKRLIYQGTFNAIQHILENRVLTSDDLIRLRNMMEEMGYDTPCGICYVESRRRNIGVFAKKWLDNYDANGGYQPKLDDVTTTDGLNRMLKEHPEVYQSYLAEMNRKGSNNPKVVQMRTDYRGDIRDLTETQIKKITEIGGLRVQSFSDFETPHLLDMMQAVLDMVDKGLTSQAYTKVPNFAWVFGDTGIKINLSLIGEGNGLDADGNLIFSSYEGMDFDEAMRLRDRYSQNVGTILVGMNDAHIRAAMADPRIDFIIPFHKSGWGKKQLSQLTGMSEYKDYTKFQNERIQTGRYKNGNPKGKNVKENFQPVGPNGYWGFKKTGNENAETYLRMCEKDGRIPKFNQFLTKDAEGKWVAPDGYWKLLIDFKMYDNGGVGAPQTAVQPNFNMKEAMRVLAEYEGGADTLPVAQDVVDRFVSEYRGIKPDQADTENLQFSLPSDEARLRSEIAAWMGARSAQMAEASALDGVSQTAINMPRYDATPKLLTEQFETNPELRNYKISTNKELFDTAMSNIENVGYEVEVNRLLNTERFTAADNVEAGLIALAAMENGDAATSLEMALKWRTQTTNAAQVLQSQKIFSKLSPQSLAIKLAGRAEAALQDYAKHRPGKAKKVADAAKEKEDIIKRFAGGDKTLEALMSEGEVSITAENAGRYGIPINDQQRKAIKLYELEDVARPGIDYNRATLKQRMLEFILSTPDLTADSGNGVTGLQRLEWMKEGAAVLTKADIAYITERIREYGALAEEGQALRPGDLALARAYEAYGNIQPVPLSEKMRTWRYTSMLLSLASAERNLIGNAAMTVVNTATHDTFGVLTDYITSLFTGKRTTTYLDVKERADGWRAWRDESINTFRDFYIDKANTNPAEDRFSLKQRGRVYQHDAFEVLRNTEGFLMSFGDRNFWKRAFVNSLAEQQKIAEMNGVEFDYDVAAEQAARDADFATFNEDGAIRQWLSKGRKIPGLGFAMDMIAPFTGVTTNITKRMVQYSPIGLATSFIKHGIRAKQGKEFDQRDFVNGVSRGLSGSVLLALGFGLHTLGAIELGTGEEDDEKVYNLGASQGKQFSPYIRIGDTYMNLSTFAPSISPIIMGAAIHESLKDDENALTAVKNAVIVMGDQIFDASYMSGLKDLTDKNGSFTENTLNTLASNAISQNIPVLLGQMASALDPYVRDTKDKNAIMQAIKTGVSKIPIARNLLLNEKRDISGQEFRNTGFLGASFVNPFTLNYANDDASFGELERLYDELGSSTHIPTYLVKNSGKVTILADIADNPHVAIDRSKGENNFALTADQRNYYNELYGRVIFDGTGDERYRKITKKTSTGTYRITGIRELMQSAAYQRMSDEEKANAIEEIISEAKRLVQAQMVIDLGYYE